MILTLVSVALTLMICFFVAYGLSMYDFKLKNLLFFLVIATMMVPFEILMLPLYQEMISLKLNRYLSGCDSAWSLCSIYNLFFRQYLIAMPKELLDAGRIDGATEYGISVSRLCFLLQNRLLRQWQFFAQWVHGIICFGQC